MTRRSEGLDSREPVPIVEMYPLAALDVGVGEGDEVRVTNPQLDPYARIAAFEISAVRIEPVHLPAAV
jgi:predicted molibdopterin-dependent oxidoreductase YjgC